jgi:hypothetical protein
MKRLLFALMLCQAGFALAQPTPATGSATTGATAASFRCGGVGEDEQKQIKAEAAQHDMLLTFAAPSGAYLADVDVEISSAGKTVLQAHCDGPLMLVDLPGKGSYQVKAVLNGREQVKTVTLRSRPARLSFIWPAS